MVDAQKAYPPLEEAGKTSVNPPRGGFSGH